MFNITSEVSLPDGFIEKYSKDEMFGDAYILIKGEQLNEKIRREKASRMTAYYSILDDVLYYENKICVSRNNLRDMLHLAHVSQVFGHFGYSKTLLRLGHYYWKWKSQDVLAYCKWCTVYLRNKVSRSKPLGEPQLLEIPDRRWGSVSMVFVTHLPVTPRGFHSTMTFVDRFTKRIHLVPSIGTDSATEVADCFFNHVFCHNGLRYSIVWDMDPKFTSKFWKHRLKCCGIQLKMSTSRHRQTDRSTEIMNRMIENYLRCYFSFHQSYWDTLLSSAEFAYN